MYIRCPSDAKTPDLSCFCLLFLILYQLCGLRCIKINIRVTHLSLPGFCESWLCVYGPSEEGLKNVSGDCGTVAGLVAVWCFRSEVIAVSQVEGAYDAFGVCTMSASCTELGNETRGQAVSGLEGASVFVYSHSVQACTGNAGAKQKLCSCAEIIMGPCCCPAHQIHPDFSDGGITSR